MVKVPANSFFLLSKRAYNTVAMENVVVVHKAAASTMRNALDLSEKEVATGQKEVFWMRDPNTGNWIPETQFHQVDVAELRDKLLPKKPKF
ncbi:senescence-associated gene 21 like protein [Actinidia chinensis var. chinensis]|uniref:Senescence-associated gene 21 like protein n=1 Tax=Actinidia chinensis var. chinensis TaxID=1590841 RepID=A0A2R6R0H8_ACTCC|nr:senescence-associated gene 21 like protein [Actinidia chinensis var. chinensis]